MDPHGKRVTGLKMALAQLLDESTYRHSSFTLGCLPSSSNEAALDPDLQCASDGLFVVTYDWERAPCSAQWTGCKGSTHSERRLIKRSWTECLISVMANVLMRRVM